MSPAGVDFTENQEALLRRELMVSQLNFSFGQRDVLQSRVTLEVEGLAAGDAGNPIHPWEELLVTQSLDLPRRCIQGS